MSKLNINDIEYIVMEGGGGRGATYLGAIRALEELMSKNQNKNSNEIFVYDIGKRTKPGLLDYYKIEDGKEVPIIKGIAGSSAGAITTFALALGLNSDEISQVLKYDFDNFLKNADVGKYRMINEEGELAVGEDKKDANTYKKVMEQSSEFEFNFNKAETKIGNNAAKKIKNDLILTAVFKVISDGVTSNLSFIEKWITNLFKDIKTDVTPPFLKKLLTWMFQPKNNIVARLGIAGALNLLVFKIIIPQKAKVPIKITGDNVMAMIYDRGMFSGFAVREFFMDLIIYAATRETAFHRGLVRLFENGQDLKKHKEFFGEDGQEVSLSEINRLLNYEESFDIADARRRIKSGIGGNPNIQNILKLLSNLKFQQLYEITKVNFGLSVTNYTTGMPLYFGHEWTPDFRVMEAVGASMSIPPAIKPVYNESDVIKVKDNETPYRVSFQSIGESNIDKAEEEKFVRDDKTFDVKDYYFYEHIVKMALAQEMEKEGNHIDVNNSIELNSFLTKLKELAIGKIDDKTGLFKSADSDSPTSLEKMVNGKKYTVNYALYKFFYNATFKGLLLDGGYRNNIPYNFFRKKEGEKLLDNVLALKLDGDFPEPLLKEVYKHVEKYVKIEDLLSKSGYDLEDKTVRSLMNMLDTERLKIRAQVGIIFGNELASDVIKLLDVKDKKETL